MPFVSENKDLLFFEKSTLHNNNYKTKVSLVN